MGSEIRQVPKDWKHPRDAQGKYIPLYGRSFKEDAARWDEEAAQWKLGLMRDHAGTGWEPILKEWEGRSLTEVDGERPKKEWYMPDWSAAERTHFQWYENITEGTPISPVMETELALGKWIKENCS